MALRVISDRATAGAASHPHRAHPYARVGATLTQSAASARPASDMVMRRAINTTNRAATFVANSSSTDRSAWAHSSSPDDIDEQIKAQRAVLARNLPAHMRAPQLPGALASTRRADGSNGGVGGVGENEDDAALAALVDETNDLNLREARGGGDDKSSVSEQANNNLAVGTLSTSITSVPLEVTSRAHTLYCRICHDGELTDRVAMTKYRAVQSIIDTRYDGHNLHIIARAVKIFTDKTMATSNGKTWSLESILYHIEFVMPSKNSSLNRSILRLEKLALEMNKVTMVEDSATGKVVPNLKIIPHMMLVMKTLAQFHKERDS